MRYFIFVFLFACSAEEIHPSGLLDVGKDQTDIGMDQTYKPIDLSRDLRSEKDVGTFPDPNREGSKSCSDDLDCKRLEFCSLGACVFSSVCGLFGKPPDFDEIKRGCLIDEHGLGTVTAEECETDEICPSNMPYCYLRACQTVPSCNVDAECLEGQFCDFETWCTAPPPCEGDRDCFRGRCGEEGLCDYFPQRRVIFL